MAAAIFHLTEPVVWEEAAAAGSYTASTRGATLTDVGFIHCSFAPQVQATAALVYPDVEHLVCLEIDPDLAGVPLRVEAGEAGGEQFPHLYGALPVEAVRTVHRLVRTRLGWFPADTVIDPQGRPEPPVEGDEAATLLGFLDFQRATFAWKCWGLDAVGLRTSVPPSTMTLGGLMKHLALVEDHWSHADLHGRPMPAVWQDVDWDADRDWDWHSAAADSPQQLQELWTAAVRRSRALLLEALTTGGLGLVAQRRWSDGRAPSLRWILTHLIEEYARHNGHADLLREAVDGATGE